jgi:uncharacterized protein YukE
MAKKDLDVTTEDISRIESAAYDEYQETLLEQARAMMAAIEALNNTWQGPNHDSFVRGYVARKQGIDDFHSLLSELLRALGEAVREYNDGEATVAGYIR